MAVWAIIGKTQYLINFNCQEVGMEVAGSVPGSNVREFWSGRSGLDILQKENFIQNSLRFLSFWKTKSKDYGTTGNDQIGDYQYLSTYNPNGYYLSGN